MVRALNRAPHAVGDITRAYLFLWREDPYDLNIFSTERPSFSITAACKYGSGSGKAKACTKETRGAGVGGVGWGGVGWGGVGCGKFGACCVQLRLMLQESALL